MKIETNEPPREFAVGLDNSIIISDCGKIFLEPDQQVTFINPEGKEHDFAAKSWGFYATPSVNGRLKKQGFKTALVRNSFGMYYIMVVDPSKMEDFLDYVEFEKQEVIEWLDER